MNSDTYQHKQVTGGSDSAGEEMETGKDISNVSHKHTVLIMAGSLLALLFWIATAGHSGGARGGQYVTASGDGMTQEGGVALAADLFSLDSEVDLPNDTCGPDCQSLVAKVAAASVRPPMCADSVFNNINGIDYCFAPCNLYTCDHGTLVGLDLTSVASMFTGKRGGCKTEYCRTGNGDNSSWGPVDVCPSHGSWDYASYLCQKSPKLHVPPPNEGNMCITNGSYVSKVDGKEYCWSTCSTASGNRSCSSRKGFWKLGERRVSCGAAGEHRNLCQKS